MAATLESLTATIASTAPVHLLHTSALVGQLAHRWSERHRSWHGPTHLLSLFRRFEAEPDGREREILLLAALYHDVIYDPRRADNEEASAALLLSHANDPSHPVVARTAELIIATKWAEPPADALTWNFWEADCRPLATDLPVGERLAYERAIFREYQWAPWPMYQTKRAEFLLEWSRRFPQQRGGAEACLDLLMGLSPRMAVYPGSFNPFHRGHLSILRQAEALFDKVIVGLAVNRQKPGAAGTLASRRAALEASLRFHEVAEIPGLLTDFIEPYPLPLTVVRGLRDGTDLEADLRYARFLNELRPDTRLVWIACEAELQHLSSSAIRELNAIAESAGQRYVPDTAEVYGTPV
jgi:pantetheine-phosphate adenylyltransferase